jgi:TPR repeat protein
MYYEGQGVPQDYAEAAKWYRLAADRGYPEAQYNLGVFSASGEAWEADNVSAYMWFSLAAASFPASDTRRNTAVTSRDVVAKQMTRDQIAEAQKRTREWKPAGVAARDRLAGQ